MIRLTDIQDQQINPSTTKVIAVFAPDRSTACSLPLYVTPVSAGFPSPAEDYLEGKLDLNKHLIKHPSATFFVRVTGESMIDVGIHEGDMLIVDRALEPHDGSIVIAVVDGELTVKRLRKKADELLLVAENKNYQPIAIGEQTAFEIWGVVTNVIHSL
jgi:DNA polymerase V